MILIIDFGSQTTHLISRRINELGVKTEIVEPESSLIKIKQQKPDGIILSGGPASVYDKNSPGIDRELFNFKTPVLGICYGQQLAAHVLEGKVKPGKIREYGPAHIKIKNHSPLFEKTADEFTVWMSHGDEVIKPPEGFEIIATTKTIPIAAMADEKKKLYGIQFHPEVVHTQFGETVLSNFLKICKLKPKPSPINKKYIDSLVEDIKESIGKEKAICALSGGVDSSVASLLVHKAIGKNLTSIYIDSGLMREGETEQLRKVFKNHFHMNVDIVDAKEIFLKALKGVVDPEQKRKMIGKTFIEVFEKEAKKLGATFLVQGTIYPDVIESAGSKHSQNIKSHHNVGGLPEKMNLALVEPLRTFYKDQVRLIGKILGLPKSITQRQPFPGPGLAVRIIGEVSSYNLEILRKADAIVQHEVKKSKVKNLWQAFAIFTGIQTTGVRGDQRVYGETIAIRAIEAKDAMSADVAKLPYELLLKISNRIVTELKDVNRVVYDITTKPPATMEWE
jgi:GMP synthase (glutamine-hydrolysing)